MAVKIDYSKTKSAMEAFQAVKENITPETLAKFKVSASLDYFQDKNEIKAKGTGFDLNMKFNETHAEIELKLSFLLKPFHDKVMGSIEKQLRHVL